MRFLLHIFSNYKHNKNTQKSQKQSANRIEHTMSKFSFLHNNIQRKHAHGILLNGEVVSPFNVDFINFTFNGFYLSARKIEFDKINDNLIINCSFVMQEELARINVEDLPAGFDLDEFKSKLDAHFQSVLNRPYCCAVSIPANYISGDDVKLINLDAFFQDVAKLIE